jgi:hypothetical protein
MRGIGAAGIRVLICAVKNSRKRLEARVRTSATRAGAQKAMPTGLALRSVASRCSFLVDRIKRAVKKLPNSPIPQMVFVHVRVRASELIDDL